MTDRFALLIAGTRTYNDYDEFARVTDKAFSNHKPEDVLIISGGASGADALAERYARERGIEAQVFPANWDKYGKRAGYIRNRQMHERAAEFEGRGCLCFWDGKSKGTRQSFGLAEEFGTPIKVFNYKEKRFLHKEELQDEFCQANDVAIDLSYPSADR